MSETSSGIRISISVKNGSATISPIERSETLPEISEAIWRYSCHLQSFSRVHLRNDAVVPVENALSHTAIKMAPRLNNKKLFAKSNSIVDKSMRNFEIMSAFFCQK